MRYVADIRAIGTLWLDSVARTLLNALERIAAPRVLRLAEQDDGTFRVEAATSPVTVPPIRITGGKVDGGLSPAFATLIKGSRAELSLLSKHFLFRPLELPRRAGEFLDGIVRAQIDRLTPWTIQDAVFGCTPPIDIANDRIALTIAATARAAVLPHVHAFTNLGARSVSVSTSFEPPDAATVPVTILRQSGRDDADMPRLRYALLLALLFAVAAAVIIVSSAAIVSTRLENEAHDVARQIAAQRVAMRSDFKLPSAAAAAQRALAQRKHETPSSVILLEALSRALPDNTYLTELRLEGNKLQMVGMTRNAPALIPLIEQSSHFTRATFFAPTTQAPNDPRERFHIETRVQSAPESGT